MQNQRPHLASERFSPHLLPRGASQAPVCFFIQDLISQRIVPIVCFLALCHLHTGGLKIDPGILQWARLATVSNSLVKQLKQNQSKITA
eukprot:5131039-Amphidinium_carterae.1